LKVSIYVTTLIKQTSSQCHGSGKMEDYKDFKRILLEKEKKRNLGEDFYDYTDLMREFEDK
jgi:hypothetical protein